MQLKELEPKQVNHKAIDGEKAKNKNKVVEDKSKTTKTKVESLNPPPSFLQRLRKHQKEVYNKKFIDVFKQVHVNNPLINVLLSAPKYAKYIIDIIASKKPLN